MSFWNPLSWRRNTQKVDNGLTEQEDSRNGNYLIFANVNSDIERAIASRSIIANEMDDSLTGPLHAWKNITTTGTDLAMPVLTDKPARIQQYRLISRYPECDWALDQIAEDFIHTNIDKKFITLTLPPVEKSPDLNDTRRDILQTEFDKFIDMFNLKDNAHNLVKRFLIEGELCWENVIKHDKPELGIIGIRFIEALYFETLIDLKTALPVGILIDTEKMKRDVHEIVSAQCQSNALIFNNIIPTTGGQFAFDPTSAIPLLWSLITYISSDDKTYDNITVYPVLEKARQAYLQLALLQDAAVILRVTRAPERLLFNISTGKMPLHFADEKVKDFSMSLKSKKVATNGGKDVASVYNPVSMLEAYVFGKSDSNDGTTVSTVGSSADYDQLGDIEFFLRRFFKLFNIPWSRYKTPENTMEKNDAMNYEEYAFSRSIIRYQRRFALGFKRSFITHLKLRGIWEKYELKESDLDIEFVKPVLYDLYLTGKEMELRYAIYKFATEDSEVMSKTLAMEKCLGWSELDIVANFKKLIKEKEMIGLAEYFTDKLKGEGPTKDSEFFKSPIPIRGIDDVELKSEDSKSEGDGESGEGGEEAPPEEAKPAEEAPAPTFGLS